ncbi:phenylacetaldehyde oxime monooxygenase CYP71AN24-like [Humulus lupulus]|uniref:phenylacetaldehyde oxime monooxygenase CYP71AN24-like n=1 Tax=Humulus lupulus TaxID=3486 RepID=UPI002B40463C|nr:phenylacetaldehyde oxime monooxygenase CYP71AN24-like [Humulus lupulus]
MQILFISNMMKMSYLTIMSTCMDYPMFLISIFFISSIILFTCFRFRTESNLPPSPPGLPLIGNLHLLGTHPHRSLRALSTKYGPLMLLQMGHVPTLVVSTSEMVKEIVKKHDVIFSDRPKTSAADIYLYGCQDLGFAPYGAYWRQIRKVCVLELLSLKRVHQFHFVREEETALLVNKVRKGCADGACINLSEMLAATSSNIVSRCILGQRFEDENGQNVFGELSKKVLEDFVAFSAADFFPSKYLRWIDVVTGFKGRLNRRFQELDTFFQQLVQEHKDVLKSDHNGSGRKDFAGILLGLEKDGMLDFKLTPEKTKALLMDLFVGASDTTSTALEWLMAELVKNPRVMKKAQEEVRRVVGNKSEIDMNDINQMDYLKCVVKENLRLHPPLPLSLPRKTLSSVKLGGYDIQENTRVLINVFAIQRDPSEWDNPEEFFPERFENNPIDFKMGQDFQFVPFGIGRRGCPASAFGTISIEYVIAHLLYWFDWTLPASDDGGTVLASELDMSEDCAITVHKKTSLQLVPKPYSV